MKKYLLILIAFLGVLHVNAQLNNSMKVVVSDKVEVWTPEKGKGFVYRKDGVKGNINVRKGPGTKYPVVAQMTEEDDLKDYPDNVCDCLGKKNGWYKISIKGKVGYVRQDLVLWAAYYAD